MSTRAQVVTLVVVSLVFLATASCFVITSKPAVPGAPEDYPTREVVDTRQYDVVTLDDSLHLIIVDAYYKALPNEMGLCVYGRYAGDSIAVTGVGADSTFTAEGSVRIFCPDVNESGDLILGDVHSHPRAMNPAYPCMPSQQDYLSLLVDNYGIMVIYCANGSGVTVFRDGRWWNFAWR